MKSSVSYGLAVTVSLVVFATAVGVITYSPYSYGETETIPALRATCNSAVDWTDLWGNGCDLSVCDAPYGGFMRFNTQYVGTTARMACCECNGSASAALEYAPPISDIVVHVGYDEAEPPCVAGFTEFDYSAARTTPSFAAWSVGTCAIVYNLTARPIASAGAEALNWMAVPTTASNNETQVIVADTRANVFVQDASTGRLLSTVNTESGVTVRSAQCALSCWIEWKSSCHETQLTLRECSSRRVLYEAPQFSDCAHGRISPKICLDTTKVEVEMRDIWGDGWNGGVVVCASPLVHRRYVMEAGNETRHADLCDP